MALELVAGDTVPGCPHCAIAASNDEVMRQAISILEADLQNAEMALRSERRRTNLLQGQLDKLLDESAEGDEVREVFRVWQGACNHPRSKLLAERKKLIGRMVSHYGKEQCVLAVIGAAYECYTDPKTGHRYDDIENIFKTEGRFEKFLGAGRRACAPQLKSKRERVPVIAALIRAGFAPTEYDLLQILLFECPVCYAGRDDPQGIYRPLRIRYDGKAGYCSSCFADLARIEAEISTTTLFEVAA